MDARTPDQQAKFARGSVSTARPRNFGPAWLAWTDPKSGERLGLELWGDEEFLVELESIGFERLDPDDAATLLGRTGGSNCVRPSTAFSGDLGGAGSTPPAIEDDSAQSMRPRNRESA